MTLFTGKYWTLIKSPRLFEAVFGVGGHSKALI